MPRSRRFRTPSDLLAFGLLVALISSPASGAARAWRVPEDYASLQTAMALAADGDSLLVAAGFYAEEPLFTELGYSMLILDRALTIIGEGEVILHAGLAGRVMLVQPGGSSSTLIGLEFRGGLAWNGGAILQRGAQVNLSSCNFRENAAEQAGGAVFADGGTLSCDACLFDSNRSGGGGGEIFLSDAAAELTACTLVGGDAFLGGGLYLGPGAHAELKQCIMVGESAELGGWAFVHDGFLYADQCTFFGIPGDELSGGIHLRGEVGSAYIETSILCFAGRAAVESERDGSAMLLCSNLYGNVGGDWSGVVAAQVGLGGNLSADPGFCALMRGDFAIDEASPCAPANNPCEALIGALGVGCPEEVEPVFETSRSEGE